MGNNMVAGIDKLFGNIRTSFKGIQGVDNTSTTSGAYVSSTYGTDGGSISETLDKKFPPFSPESRDNIRGQRTYYMA